LSWGIKEKDLSHGCATPPLLLLWQLSGFSHRPSQLPIRVRISPRPSVTVCSFLISSKRSRALTTVIAGFSGLDAALFRKCIQNVPFDKEKAEKTVKNVRRFMLLESSSDYYIDPPTTELELQPFNLNKTFDTIESNIEKEVYKNNWSWEYDMVQLFQLYRDGHTDYEVRFSPFRSSFSCAHAPKQSGR
jgi:hypothetical protein